MRKNIAPTIAVAADSSVAAPALTRAHARRLREVYRSAGWPSQDGVEIELLAAGLLERCAPPAGGETLRVTDAGLRYLAQVLQRNRQALSTHDALVAQVARSLLLAGRVVWTGLAVRAHLPEPGDGGATDGQTGNASGMEPAMAGDLEPFDLIPGQGRRDKARWKVCKPDVFSIRNTTVAAYLQPVVHEIKVSRADLLGDLRLRDKRDSYLDVGGQCWYVLGSDARGRPIAQADEVPPACGVIYAQPDGRLDVARHAPARAMADLPFALWMALAKAPALSLASVSDDEEPGQALLQLQATPGAGPA
ncbi:MAG: hypothetical protein ABJA49_00175 [Betaproteobacteria bacterium]